MKTTSIDSFLQLTWTTQDGRTLKLSEMSLEHLKNCERFCANKAERYMIPTPAFGGEMAQYYAEQQAQASWSKAYRFQQWRLIFKTVIEHKENDNSK